MKLLLLITGFGLFLAGVVGLYALITRKRTLFKGIVKGALMALGLYFAALRTVSLTSREKELALSDEKRFCGSYLDHYLSASVVKVENATSLGSLTYQQPAQGTYYVVTAKIRNAFPGRPVQPHSLEAIVVDDQGRAYRRSALGEGALAAAQGKATPFEQPAAPGDFYTKDLVFDLPSNIRNPSLLVTEGNRSERLVELFLIGEEGSLLHKKTKFRLSPGPHN